MAATDPKKKLSSRELSNLNKKLDQQLADLNEGEESSSAESSVSSSSNIFAKALFYIVLLISGLIAPFFLLVRTSVYIYSEYDLHGWLALGAGVLATILLLLCYALFVRIRFSKSWFLNRYVRSGIAVLVAAYTLYGAFYFSELNAKSEEISSYYRSLHPIMRVALSTATLADSDIIVTDIRRSPEDYEKMGLAQKQHSLHFVQEDGYVHAVDLRTKGRAEWKNWLLAITFEGVGLETIRHVGTADHLHLYLSLND
ncbi:hypothetical protein [Fodinibius halophilus]|uniref:Uncharacterized protein n=1 Tax=Fodinibius halophilus TaxID=1736908 RepID=A0A6M1T6A1_9BACT|nr:hypothetical protein [Fodinibius halophilus]NGP87541.1 hypothetical protein [Fodinibius halophilus]